MDESIQPVTPEAMRRRGAHAFDQGLGIDDHGFNWHAIDAIADWRKGWQERQAQVDADRILAAAMVMGATPP
jgi:hypothetical protein